MTLHQRITVSLDEYSARDTFLPFHRRTQRFACMVAHRRAGKTVATLNDMIIRAILPHADGLKHRRYGYIAPFRSQAKENVWEYLKRYAGPIIADKSEVDLSVTLINGSRIRLYGADNPDALRGGYFDGVVCDELGDMRPSVRTSVVSPMLADRKGWEVLIGTPKGRNAFYDAYKEGLAKPDEWFTGIYKASDTGILDDAELEAQRRKMSRAEYAQEFECSFEAALVGAYYTEELAALDREGRLVDGLAIDPTEPIHTAWDLGHGKNMVVWAFQSLRNRINILDCISVDDWYFRDYVQAVNDRGYHGQDFVPHDIKAPDFITSRTRVEFMSEAGRKPELVGNYSVDDGINAVKSTLPMCYFDISKPGVKSGVDGLRQYRQLWDDKERIYKQIPHHNWASHFADGFRYLAWGWRTLPAQAAPPPQPVFPGLNQMSMDQFMDIEGQALGRRSPDKI